MLGAGPAQRALLEAAAARGVWTAACDRDPAAVGFRVAARRCIVGVDDEAALARLAAALELGGVIAPGADRGVAVAARIAEKLALPHPLAPPTALLATNALRQRQALAAAGVPQPRFELAGDGHPALRPPLVVRAPDRLGQEGPAVVRDERALAAALARARARARGGPVLVEEEVGGPEVTVTGFSAGGVFCPLAVTDRIVGPAFGVALAHAWPSPHAEAAVEVTRRAVAALGIESGPTSTRLRVGAGGPEVIGVSARLPGEYEAELIEAVAGVDLHGLALAAALGYELDPADVARRAGERRVGGAVVRFLVAPPGVLERVEVPQGLPGVVRTWIDCEPGCVLAPLRRASDRAGALLAVGRSREEAAARAEAAAERIRFRTADAEALV